MRHDFRVLSFSIDRPEAAWAEEVASAYAEGDYNGIYLRVQRDLRLADLDSLQLLTGLQPQYLEVNGAVLDDAAAFGIESLRELVLLTRCRAPIPGIAATKLGRLGIDDRPGKENIGMLPNLRSLLVWSWQSPDFRFLVGARELVTMHIEGIDWTAETTSLRGVEGCSSLEEIELDVLRVDSLRPLLGLSNLRRLWLIGPPGATGDVVLDLEDVADLAALEELRLTFAGSVRSVQPLARMTKLRDVRLRGTQIIDGDEAPLARLRERATVVFPAE